MNGRRINENTDLHVIITLKTVKNTSLAGIWEVCMYEDIR